MPRCSKRTIDPRRDVEGCSDRSSRRDQRRSHRLRQLRWLSAATVDTPLRQPRRRADRDDDGDGYGGSGRSTPPARSRLSPSSRQAARRPVHAEGGGIGCEKSPEGSSRDMRKGAAATGTVGYADHHDPGAARKGGAERKSGGHMVPVPLMPFSFHHLCIASGALAEGR